MQLFILDYDPVRSAQMLCDVHLRKMCLENAQILSGILLLQGRALEPGMPRCFNLNHPVIRAVNTPPKINYAVLYNEALHQEYCRRFCKKHAYFSLASLYRKHLFTAGIVTAAENLSFARDFKDIEISEPDIVQAYRIYYRYKKSRLKKWNYTCSEEPDFLISSG